MSFSLYIHIPFCEVKCGYCDFFSIPRGYQDFDLQKEYVGALIREIEARSPSFAGRQIQSIFFGGGTPSLLEPGLIEKILATLRKYFFWDPTVEITLESNPKTVSFEKLKEFLSLGINRLSIGVQSFQDSFLKSLGRIHTGEEARKTVKDAFSAGFENVSLDLIFALPGQSFRDWEKDLETAMTLETPHLSAYHLTIEPGTPFASRRLRLPAEEEGVRMLTWTRERLCQVRMEPYEISNFSRRGFESIHNQNYWRYGEYLGFGTAAASFLKNPPIPPLSKGGEGGFLRRTNVRDLKKYLNGQWEASSEEIPLETAMGEFCMLAFRTREGIDEEKFSEGFGGRSFREVYAETPQKWVARGFLESTTAGWRLTKEGVLFTDEVAISFLP